MLSFLDCGAGVERWGTWTQFVSSIIVIDIDCCRYSDKSLLHITTSLLQQEFLPGESVPLLTQNCVALSLHQLELPAHQALLHLSARETDGTVGSTIRKDRGIARVAVVGTMERLKWAASTATFVYDEIVKQWYWQMCVLVFQSQRRTWWWRKNMCANISCEVPYQERPSSIAVCLSTMIYLSRPFLSGFCSWRNSKFFRMHSDRPKVSWHCTSFVKNIILQNSASRIH